MTVCSTWGWPGACRALQLPTQQATALPPPPLQMLHMQLRVVAATVGLSINHMKVGRHLEALRGRSVHDMILWVWCVSYGANCVCMRYDAVRYT